MRGYAVDLAHIPAQISPYNRLLLCRPGAVAPQQPQRAEQQEEGRAPGEEEPEVGWWGAPAVPKGKVPPPPIPLSDVAAIAAMAGRKAKARA